MISRPALVLACLPSVAFAHGDRFPASVSVTLRAGAPDDVIIGTTFGLVISRDGGGSFRWLCEEAVGYGAQDPEVTWLEDGSIWVPVPGAGLYVSRDGGCSFVPHADFGDGGAAALAVAPDGVMFAAGGASILRSRDGGLSFTPVVTATAAIFLDVLAGDRVLATAWAPETGRGYVVALDGDAAEWIARGDGPAWIAGATASALFLHAAGAQGWTLLRSEDLGRTAAVVMTGSASWRGLETDEGGLLVADARGLYRVDAAGVRRLDAPSANACVRRANDALYTCGWPVDDGWSVARSDDGGASFAPVFALEDLAGVHDCPRGTPVHDVCGPLWPVLEAQLGTRAGVVTRESPAIAAPAEPRGCRCVRAEQHGVTGLVLLALAFTSWRRLRSRRSRAA